MNNPILIIILIFVGCLLGVLYIISRSVNKTIKQLSNNQVYLKETKLDVILVSLEKLDMAEKFYNKPYLYLANFKNIYKEEYISLYLEEYDALELHLNDEYHILHDGVVVFEIKNVIM